MPKTTGAAPLDVAVDEDGLQEGGLRAEGPTGTVISGMRLRLRLPDGIVSGTMVAAGEEAGHDAAGAFQLGRWQLDVHHAPVDTPPLTAVLELRRSREPEVMVATLAYDGPPLADERGAEVLLALDSFARGLALKRIKPSWTAPTFVSDPRLLSPANLLLLWQRMADDRFHLLVPLAGDGMVAEVGHDGYELRVAAGSRAHGHAPRRVPLFAYAAGADPFRLAPAAYRAAWPAAGYWGRLREDKPLPAPLAHLGWCSRTTYDREVTEAKVLASARSLRDRDIAVGFIALDDGWLTVNDRKLAGFGAAPASFPGGLGGLAATLKGELGVRHLGIWHALQGHWSGVDPTSAIGRRHRLFTGALGQALPDPRDGAGRSFYDEWYRELAGHGFDVVTVDNQAASARFTDGLLPLFEAGVGAQQDHQEAAAAHGLAVVAGMAMSLEGALAWRHTAVARNSDDYVPDDPQATPDHLLRNAYNALWTSCFAWPDWDLFRSHDRDAEVHAVARAISGGPITFTDEPGKERPELLHTLTDRAGRLLRLDAPGLVTRDLLLSDPAMTGAALKVWGTIRRPGLEVGMVAAFHVDKRADQVTGTLRGADVEGVAGASFAVWCRSAQAATTLERSDALPFLLARGGVELFTLAPLEGGAAVFGRLDKLLGAAAIERVARQPGAVEIALAEGGELGAWLAVPPRAVEIDGGALPSTAWSFEDNLLRIPAACFPAAAPPGGHRVRIALG